MASSNVIPPSDPEYSHTENLYPYFPVPAADDFRLQKISDVQKELENKADHYRRVAKKYKKAFFSLFTVQLLVQLLVWAL